MCEGFGVLGCVNGLGLEVWGLKLKVEERVRDEGGQAAWIRGYRGTSLMRNCPPSLGPP